MDPQAAASFPLSVTGSHLSVCLPILLELKYQKDPELEGNWKCQGRLEDLQENQESCPEPEAVACKGDPAGDDIQERDEFSRIPRTISSPAATQASVPDDSRPQRCSAPGKSRKQRHPDSRQRERGQLLVLLVWTRLCLDPAPGGLGWANLIFSS
ncbi:hypothetical protein H8959_019323 [Pygathrix nigripes]